MDLQMERDPLLFGHCTDTGLVAIELAATREQADEAVLFFRREGRTVEEREPLQCFILAESAWLARCPLECDVLELKGRGPLNACARFSSWSECGKVKDWLVKESGFSVSAPGAPFVFLNDPVQQHLMMTGRAHFAGMRFEDLKRLQVDIECATTEGYEFCNAQREGDAILAIGLGDGAGWTEILSTTKMDEKSLLERFVAIVAERDPDVIEGHNLFNFDLPYLSERARRHKVKLAIGRGGRVPRKRPSRWSAGERSIAYTRFDVSGRHVVDTLFLVHSYDVSHRSLDGFGLKEAAVHFGIAAPDRTYIEGSQITRQFAEDPETVLRYLRDDVLETGALSNLLSRSSFVQAQMLPYSYQNVCVRGNATKIDALMMRDYLRQGHAVPLPDTRRDFAGGYTDMFVQGVVKNVHHCDVRSLYPSLMLADGLAPGVDELGTFLRLLRILRDFRVQAKTRLQAAGSDGERLALDALQSTFKVLINSFYGYLGFSQARFSDFDVAEEVTRKGRELLRSMITWLREHGAVPVEIDTDGIYFVPPSMDMADADAAREAFRQDFAAALPRGIDIEFDGEYESMYSYKMKNYALLTRDGEMIVKGAALKSRGIERFQRAFLRESIRLRLEGREAEIPALAERYEKAITEREWGIDQLAKTETLQDSPATYAAKLAKGGRARSAAYELALASGREYRAGDQVSYYVTGEKKSVAVHEVAKLASAWDAEARDENVAYYLAKFKALNAKFGHGDPPRQQVLDLSG